MALVLAGAFIDMQAIAAMTIAAMLRTLHLKPAVVGALIAIEIGRKVTNIPGILSRQCGDSRYASRLWLSSWLSICRLSLPLPARVIPLWQLGIDGFYCRLCSRCDMPQRHRREYQFLILHPHMVESRQTHEPGAVANGRI